MQYTDERLIPMARQIFGEMVYGLGNPPAYGVVRSFLTSGLDAWETVFKPSFMKTFPERDPELTRQAFEYILNHFDEMKQGTQEVYIRDCDKRRFGFGE